jgi:NAD(P)-dependent dehydrogenase (short-subunit alcohol dehydrogenase family)
VENFFQFVSERLPYGIGVHALVNNAGIIRAGADDWLSLEDYEEVFRVNVGRLKRTLKLQFLR